MPNGERFTAYLSPGELAQLRYEAARTRTTVNYQIRTAVRQFLGLEDGEEAQLPVTTVTRREAASSQ